MGYRFEVTAFMEIAQLRSGDTKDVYYEWLPYYGGESFVGALKAMRRAKKAGAGCVKLEWR